MRVTPINTARNIPMRANPIQKPATQAVSHVQDYIDIAKTLTFVTLPMWAFLYLERLIFKDDVKKS